MSDFSRNTRAMLLAHQEHYPLAQIRDYLKFLFQSSFGCEHLIADPSVASAYIRKEAEQAAPRKGEIIEPLDGPYCRVHLDILKEGLFPDTFAALFARSACHEDEGTAALEEKLSVLLHMADAGELSLDATDLREAIASWRQLSFPACHHSQAFRDAYAPAYRLMKADYARYLPLFCAIDRKLQQAGHLTVVIDGMCAGGKSTLATLLAEIYGCLVFHMDDYFLRPEQRTPERYAEPGGNVDRERFAEEILRPLRENRTICYRPFNCSTVALDKPITVSPTALTVIEGSYSLHPALRSDDQLSVFLRINPEKQMERIIRRNGPEYAKVFESRWIPLEQTYFDAFKPSAHCDLVFQA